MGFLNNVLNTFKETEIQKELKYRPLFLEQPKIETESIRKLSNFNFHWTKALYQNNLKPIAFFFTFFKGYKCN